MSVEIGLEMKYVSMEILDNEQGNSADGTNRYSALGALILVHPSAT